MALQKHLKPLLQGLALIFCTKIILVSSSEWNETASTEGYCPVKHSHCICSGEPYYSVSCKGLNDTQVLNRVASNLTERTLILELDSLKMMSFPLDVLKNNFLMSLIIRNSSFRTLLSAPEPCSLNNSSNIHHLALENVTTGAWSWRHFAILKKLDILFIYNTTIAPNITSTFNEHVSKSLKMLSISGSNVSAIENGAFKDFKNLAYLRISYSKLRNLSRSIFSDKPRLEQLKLDHNQIRSLPTDMFQNFANLTLVSLSNNRLSSLPQDTYQPLAENNVKLDLRNNPIKCDCRINWIVTSSFRLNITGNCSHPKKLFGRNIRDLRKGDLRC